MGEESVHEKLPRVIVRYEGGRIEPVEFRWGMREITVHGVNARWVDRATRPIRYFFSVTSDAGEIFLLSYREGEPVWYLDTVIVP